MLTQIFHKIFCTFRPSNLITILIQVLPFTLFSNILQVNCLQFSYLQMTFPLLLVIQNFKTKSWYFCIDQSSFVLKLNYSNTSCPRHTPIASSLAEKTCKKGFLDIRIKKTLNVPFVAKHREEMFFKDRRC